jgi:hypothetical protein
MQSGDKELLEKEYFVNFLIIIFLKEKKNKIYILKNRMH